MRTKKRKIPFTVQRYVGTKNEENIQKKEDSTQDVKLEEEARDRDKKKWAWRRKTNLK